MPPKPRKKSLSRSSTGRRRASHVPSEGSTLADDDTESYGTDSTAAAIAEDPAGSAETPTAEALAAMLPSAPAPRRPAETRPAFDFSSFGQVPTGPSIGVIHTDDDGSGTGGPTIFGISKEGITRALIKYLSPPKPMPLTVCFQFPGVLLSHRYVMAMMKSILVGTDGHVTGVQFIDRNVKLGTRTLDNRWLVTVNSMEIKDKLMTEGLTVVSRKIPIRSYDDVQQEEYDEYVKYLDFQRAMGMKKKGPSANPDYRDEDEENDSNSENGSPSASRRPSLTSLGSRRASTVMARRPSISQRAVTPDLRKIANEPLAGADEETAVSRTNRLEKTLERADSALSGNALEGVTLTVGSDSDDSI